VSTPSTQGVSARRGSKIAGFALLDTVDDDLSLLILEQLPSIDMHVHTGRTRRLARTREMC
jgi:hypothetical protein